jgi:hypothetical protein
MKGMRKRQKRRLTIVVFHAMYYIEENNFNEKSLV